MDPEAVPSEAEVWSLAEAARTAIGESTFIVILTLFFCAARSLLCADKMSDSPQMVGR